MCPDATLKRRWWSSRRERELDHEAGLGTTLQLDGKDKDALLDLVLAEVGTQLGPAVIEEYRTVDPRRLDRCHPAHDADGLRLPRLTPRYRRTDAQTRFRSTRHLHHDLIHRVRRGRCTGPSGHATARGVQDLSSLGALHTCRDRCGHLRSEREKCRSAGDVHRWSRSVPRWHPPSHRTSAPGRRSNSSTRRFMRVEPTGRTADRRRSAQACHPASAMF